MKTKEVNNVTLADAKHHFILRHPLGNLSVARLKKVAEGLDCFVWGDKAQILQCLTQHEYMLKLGRVCRKQREN